jgi:hypothetical protein
VAASVQVHLRAADRADRQPIVDLVLVRGFALAGCTGQQICEQSTTLTGINLFEPTAGNDLIYDPRTHDSGAIAALFAQCGCSNDDVESCRLLVHVKLQWQDPNYTLVQGYTFTVCLSCRVEDDEDDRLG